MEGIAIAHAVSMNGGCDGVPGSAEHPTWRSRASGKYVARLARQAPGARRQWPGGESVAQTAGVNPSSQRPFRLWNAARMMRAPMAAAVIVNIHIPRNTPNAMRATETGCERALVV